MHFNPGLRRRALPAFMLATIAALGACAGLGPTPSTASAESVEATAIRAAREGQNRAILAGDVDRIASFWTEDVSIRRALGAMVNGRDAYARLFAEDTATLYLRHPTTITVSDAWPLAFETGEWEGRLGGPSSPIVIRGPYSAQWVKRDGRWLIRGEVFVPLHCAGVGCSWKAVP